MLSSGIQAAVVILGCKSTIWSGCRLDPDDYSSLTLGSERDKETNISKYIWYKLPLKDVNYRNVGVCYVYARLRSCVFNIDLNLQYLVSVPRSAAVHGSLNLHFSNISHEGFSELHLLNKGIHIVRSILNL